MKFELTVQLIDEILFFMEDQHGQAFIDTRRGIVVPGDDSDFWDDDEDLEELIDNDKEDRFISLPEWDSSDGFRLMESFTASLRNPTVRNALSVALNRSRGVFRAFKDTIMQFPEMEKLWFAYKDREMKRDVILWYNGLREQWGLELIGEEPEDIEDIAREDFRFRDGSAADSAAAGALHQYCVTDADYACFVQQWIFPGDLCIVAENGNGEFAAYVTAALDDSGVLHVHALEVKPEYRGLGLGKTLLDRLLAQAKKKGFSRISMDLPAEYSYFSRALVRENFQPVVTRYCRGT